ncbi:shikimate kinase [Planctomycetales bacterium]|nr:shikimate kinase [Planctomycetales bacterium]
MTNIIFIGYRGTGKTSIAGQLGAYLQRPVFDSDPEIECLAGKSIAEIFAQDGEAAFRDQEETVIAEILRRQAHFVLATGGGAVLRSATRQRLRDAGRVFWLTAAPETILQRIISDASSRTTRPNLTSLPPLDEIKAMLEKRETLYAETAHETIATDILPMQEIVKLIIAKME